MIYVTKIKFAQLWNVKEIATSIRSANRTFNAPQIAISPNGRWFAAVTQPDVVSIWHVPSKAARILISTSNGHHLVPCLGSGQ